MLWLNEGHNAMQCSASRANSQYGDDDHDDRSRCCNSRPTVHSVVIATGLNLFKELLFVIPFLANLFACTGLFIPFVFIAKTAMSRGVDKSSAVFLLSVIGQLVRQQR